MKKFIISMILIGISSFATLYSPTLFGFKTDYPFAWYNLQGGLMCFPVLIPIGITSIIPVISLFFIFGGWLLYVGAAIDEKSTGPTALAFLRLGLFLWCIALCDYSYWDIADSHIVPNMDFPWLYQQYQHASTEHGDFALLGFLLCFLNIGTLIFHLALVPHGVKSMEEFLNSSPDTTVNTD